MIGNWIRTQAPSICTACRVSEGGRETVHVTEEDDEELKRRLRDYERSSSQIH